VALFKIIFLIFIIFTSLNGYESEAKLKAVIVGKVAKYITFQDDKGSKEFVITIYKNKCANTFDNIYKDVKINNKPVKIVYIDNIEDLGYTNVLYISKVNSATLSKILEKTKNKNIVTISSNRGFAQKGGVIQLYFVSQKLKLKINTQSATQKNLKIGSTLLRVADIVKGDKV